MKFNLPPRYKILGIIIWLFVWLILFHFLVLIQVIPFSIVWGGRLKSIDEMQRMEAVSLIINLFILGFFLSEKGYFKKRLTIQLAKIIYFILSLLFLLNTIGNVFSNSHLETWVFTPITLMLFLGSLTLALRRNEAQI